MSELYWPWPYVPVMVGKKVKMMNTYFATAIPTMIENWPASLKRLSMSSIPVKLTLDEAKAVGMHISEYGELFVEKFGRFSVRVVKTFEAIAVRVHKAVMMFEPDGAFVRLGSRSPKDAWNAPACVHNGTQAMNRLTDCSERMSDDLMLAIMEKYEPTIWVRTFVKDLGVEIRCFVKDGKLVAATQYEPKKAVDYIVKNRRSIIDSVVRYIHADFLPNSHLQDVIVDLSVRQKNEDGFHSITMIEINPYFEYTDPILFDWKKPEDIESGWFRSLDEIGHLVTDMIFPKRFSTEVLAGQ